MSPRSDRELAELHFDSLYLFDARGRLRAVNESAERRPPRLALVYTVDGVRWAARDDLPDALVERVGGLIDAAPPATDLEAEPAFAAGVRAVMTEHAPVTDEWWGPAFAIETPGPSPGGAVPVERAEGGLLAAFAGWAADLEHSRPCFVVVEDGRAVSICGSARVPRAAVEAGVETLEAYRRCGYALRVVYAWAAAVRAQGRVPLYSTAWDNAASRAVARRLRMRCYGADWSIS